MTDRPTRRDILALTLLLMAVLWSNAPAVNLEVRQEQLPRPTNLRIVRPPVSPGTGELFSCGSTGNQFWDNLVATPYTTYSKSLRSAAQMQYWPNGLVSDPYGGQPAAGNFWSYDGAEDAALLAIPEFSGVASVSITAPISSTTTTSITVSTSTLDPGDHFKCGSEVFKWTGGSLPNITVARGQRGSVATTHASGAACFQSTNSAGADIRLPSPQSGASFDPPLNKDGDSYLIIWDNKLDDSLRVSRSGLNLDVFKHVQLWSPSNLSNPGGASLRWLEHRVGFCDGCAGEQPPDFDPTGSSTHVAWLDFRCDGGGNGPAAWLAQPGGRTLFGPNVYYNGSGAACYVKPANNKRHFIVDANRWFRRATEIQTQNNNYDLVSSWAKSETRALVKLLDQLQGSLRHADDETGDTLRRISVVQLEVDSSKQSLDGREVRSVLRQWFRNFWIGANVPPSVRDEILACNVVR